MERSLVLAQQVGQLSYGSFLPDAAPSLPVSKGKLLFSLKLGNKQSYAISCNSRVRCLAVETSAIKEKQTHLNLHLRMAGSSFCTEKLFPPLCFSSVNRSKNKNISFITPIQASNSPIAGSFQTRELRFDSKVEKILDNMKWDEKGLVVAIAQNVDTGAILMQGFANREAFGTTIMSRKATFYSRSRSSLWTKGETSMNFINVHDIFIDCDRDSIIYLGKPDGPTCHTGEETCYYSSVDDLLDGTQINKARLASSTLYSLENTISQRNTEIESDQNGKKSWTKKLLLDKDLLSSKIREEAGELIQTLIENEDKHRTASEMADLLYHAMVLLTLKDVKMEQVLEILRKRFAQSGIEEKSSRKPKNPN